MEINKSQRANLLKRIELICVTLTPYVSNITR